jgi:hypothetical protein
VQKKRERMSIEDDIRALVTDRGRAVGIDGRQAARSYLLQKHDVYPSANIQVFYVSRRECLT